MHNPWQTMTVDEGRAYDARKEPLLQVQVKCGALWELVQRHLPQDPSIPILDLGGGTGEWAIRLAQAGYSVLLTDLSPGLLARAQEKIEAAGLGHRIRIELTDICDLSQYESSRFPLVLALGDPLSYCGNAERALREIHRVTQEQGMVIGDVENRYRGLKNQRRARSWEDMKRILLEGMAYWPDSANPAPIRQFTPGELRVLLEATGWHVVVLYPSDVVTSLVDDRMLQAVCASDAGFQEVMELEQCLREDASLLGCGLDIQFVARK